LPYVPADAPEAPTACRAERARAHRAREQRLEFPTLASEDEATRAVLAHAQCEAAAFAALPIAGADDDALAVALRAARMSYLSALTLYHEAARGADLPWSIAIDTGIADLDAAFAAKLRAPALAPDLEDIARVFDERARRAYLRALDAARESVSLTARYPMVATWTRRACAELSARGEPACAE
jgi:hypothetical protein